MHGLDSWREFQVFWLRRLLYEIATAKFKILNNAFKYTSGERRFLLTATRTFAKPK